MDIKFNKKIAIVLQSRKNSSRCKNKMLRKFGKSNLFTIALDKLKQIGDSKLIKIYIAVGEEEFFKILENYNFNVIKRNALSINGDKIDDVFNYLQNIKEENIIFFNPCAPNLKSSTLKKAINYFFENKIKSLTTVVKKHTWYFDHNYQPINDNTSGNTKDLNAMYECTHNFHIFNKDYFLKNKRYWSNSLADPYLFEVDHFESIDIDTEEEFSFAEKLYQS